MRQREERIFEAEDCKGCQELTREDERNKTSNRYLVEMRDIIRDEFKKHEYKEVRKIKNTLIVVILAVVIVACFTWYTYIKVTNLEHVVYEHINK